MSSEITIFVTGADGYLGQRSVESLLQSTSANFVLWLRARSDDEFKTKQIKLSKILSHPQWKSRISLTKGDLREDDPFREARNHASKITHILHTAAVIRFNIEENLARTVNIEGFQKLLKFTESLKNLKRLGYLSSLYSAGLQEGVLKEEAWTDKAGFANHYEQSKWAAENLLLSDYKHLPWQIYRVSTVIADDDSGKVSQWNAVHNSLKLLYYGLISLMPGEKSAPLYFTTGKFSASAMSDLIVAPNLDRRIYHLTASFKEAVKLDEFMETAFAAFQKSEDFKARRIMKPLYADWRGFEMLSKTVVGMGGEMLSQALQSMTPFARQLYSKKEVDTSQLAKDWKAFQPLAMKTIVTKMCDYVATTKFGREIPDEEKTENFYAY